MDWQPKSYSVEKFKLGDAVAKTGSAIGDAVQRIGLGHIELKKAELDHQAEVYKRAMEHQNDLELMHNLPDGTKSFERVHGVSTKVDFGSKGKQTPKPRAPRRKATPKPPVSAKPKPPTATQVKAQNKAAATYITPSTGKKLDPAVKAQNAAARIYITKVTPTTKKPKPIPKTTSSDN